MISKILYKLKERFSNLLWIRGQFRLFQYSESQSARRFPKLTDILFPVVGENSVETGFDRHYIYHTAWAARKLEEYKPSEHIDISSSLYFAGIVSAFLPVHFFDFRPPNLHLSNLRTGSCNITNLHFPDSSIESLSCMHVIEHIGLGRYGDQIDYDGDLKAIKEIRRVTKSGGILLFVVPVGMAEIQFNAHRIYSPDQITGYFPDFHLLEFALIPDSPKDGGILINPSRDFINQQRYACGCFSFKKK